MKVLFSRHFLYYLFIFILLAVGGWYTYKIYLTPQIITAETAIIKNTDLVSTVKVSGKVDSKTMSRLSFSVGGIIQKIYKSAGDSVTEGEVVASLTSDSLVAEYNAALAEVRYLELTKQELERGPTSEARTVADTNINIAKIALERTKVEYAQLVKNAKRLLLSTNLEALPVNLYTENVHPTISGSYLCEDGGTYTLSIYRSNSQTDISYRLSGLESGTFAATTDSPSPLGECGLSIQFDTDKPYSNGDWTVRIPNTRGANYVTLQNAYQLTKTQETEVIKTYTEALKLAENNRDALIAPPNKETLGQVNANISKARSYLALQEARVADYTIRSPFPGIVTNVDMKVGESAGPKHTVTVVQEGNFELKARIPEIDITKVTVGSETSVNFDASPAENLNAAVSFISPLSTEVGGVAYYDAVILLKNKPIWLREGLNADITIQTGKRANVPSLPQRFIKTNGINSEVYILENGQIIANVVQTGFKSTEGQVEILNFPVGTVVQLP